MRHDLRRRRARAQHVRHVRDRHHLRARPDQRIERVEIDAAVIVDIEPFQHRALALAQEMPRHDVGVMLHHRKHDLVAGLDVEPGGDDVDRLRAALGEDDVLRRRRIDEPRHGRARALVGLGRLVRQRVQAAVHVGVGAAHRAGHRFDHRFRLLRAGGVVEIDQRPAVHLARQDRKLRAHGVDIERRRRTGAFMSAPPQPSAGCAPSRFPSRTFRAAVHSGTASDQERLDQQRARLRLGMPRERM